MDSNLMSCPTCGHTVSNAAGACAYCGAKMTEDQPPPTEETGAADSPLSVDASSPSRSPETSEIPDVSEAVDKTAALRDAQSAATGPEESPEQAAETKATAPETVPLAKSGAKQNLAESNSQAAEPETKNAAEMVSLLLKSESETDTGLTADTVVETAAGTEDLVVKEIVPEKPAADNGGLVRQGEPVESILKEAQSGLAVEEIQLAAQSNPAEVTVDEASESEILGEDIIELAEIQNIDEELKITSTSGSVTSPQTTVETGEAGTLAPSQAERDSGVPIDAEAGLKTESLGDTILLEEVVDEVQPDSGKESDKIDVTARESSDDKALKIEKAAADMTVAVPKQKESLDEDQNTKNKDLAASDAEALKKQKAALAKARAVKKQKMIFAKTAALKRKKAAQAQALKKQEDARAAIEKAANSTATEKYHSTQSPDVSSKLRILLERYKGRAVGINYDNSADIREAQVVEANGEYFSVFVKDKNLKYSYPLKAILTVIEGKDGVEVGESEKKSKFNAVIKVHPLVLF